MKKLLVIALSLILTLAFAFGCTTEIGGNSGGSTDSTGTTGGSGTTDNTGSGSGSSDASTDTGDEMTEDSYTVTLQFPTTTAILPTLTGIYAIWSNGSSVYSAEFNSSGVAYRNDLDGEYTVTLSETPDGYSYNPNIYTANGGTDGRNVSIYMYALSEFSGGSGSSPNQGLRATITSTSSFSVYRVEFSSANTEFYFLYTPPTSGTYSVETYVSTYDNTVNPTLKKYASIVYWGTYVETTGGGESGTYTKNVFYEFDYAPTNQGSGLLFSISIQSADNSYPKYVDFAITWEDEYSDEDLYSQYGGAYVNVEVPDISTDWTTPDGNNTMMFTSSVMNYVLSSTTTINGTKYTTIAYNDADGFYYYCTNPELAAGTTNFDDGNWTLLFVKIQNTYSYSAVYQGSTYYIYGLLQELDFGSMYKVSVKVNGTLKNLNYYNMLTAYKAAANSDSAYPVTAELKECIQNISVARNYFYDGSGILEGEPFNFDANDEDQWLYACSVYI